MRVLFDESLPRQLASEIQGHDVRTVRQQGRTGLKNGELLRRAHDSGFAVFVTADQNLEYQQNLARSKIGVVVIAARSNRIEDLNPLKGQLLEAIGSVKPAKHSMCAKRANPEQETGTKISA